MATHDPITTAELRLAYRQVGLWRIGMGFEVAMGAQHVRWALERLALIRRRQDHQVQLRLI